MKKHFRMIYGIIAHPFKMIIRSFYRAEENHTLMCDARERTWKKNHERMHDMSLLTNTAYTSSELYGNLYRGAIYD